MSNNTIDLSIVIPAYKEADRIAASLHALADWLKAHDYGTVEVVVVAQDPETYQAAEAVKDAFEHFVNLNLRTRAGKGGAVRIGMLKAHGRYRLFMDADLATPLRHLDDIAGCMERDSDGAIAVRDLTKTHTGIRKFISKIGNFTVQTLLTPGISDTQCGFKMFRADVTEALFGRVRSTGWAFDMELLAIASLLGYRIETFAANDWHDPKGDEGLVGDSSIGVALKTGWDLIKILANKLTGRYRTVSYHLPPQQ